MLHRCFSLLSELIYSPSNLPLEFSGGFFDSFEPQLKDVKKPFRAKSTIDVVGVISEPVAQRLKTELEVVLSDGNKMVKESGRKGVQKFRNAVQDARHLFKGFVPIGVVVFGRAMNFVKEKKSCVSTSGSSNPNAHYSHSVVE